MLDLIDKHKGVNAYEILFGYPLEAFAHMSNHPDDLLSQEFDRLMKLVDGRTLERCYFCSVYEDRYGEHSVEAVVKERVRDYFQALNFCNNCWSNRSKYVQAARLISSFREFLELMYGLDPERMWIYVGHYLMCRGYIDICFPQDFEDFADFDKDPPIFVPDTSRGRSQLPCYAEYEKNLEYFERQRSKLTKATGSPADSASNANP